MPTTSIAEPENWRDSSSEPTQRGSVVEATSPDSVTTENETGDDGKGSKRTPKACDRCRHKKTKCTGDSPCQRCRLDNTVCTYTNRRPKEGPNFNPQVAQKDAAMTMLYQCIGIMNKLILSARLGPYETPEIRAKAETEDFIIGVILDRFGVSPILDEFDNQPVYLPGQKGYVPGAGAVEFPTCIPSLASMVDSHSSSHPYHMMDQHFRPLQHQSNSCVLSLQPGQPQPIIQSHNTIASAVPELERHSEYASSPETTPQTPASLQVAMEIDRTLDLTDFTSCTSPPPPFLSHSDLYSHGAAGSDMMSIHYPPFMYPQDSSSAPDRQSSPSILDVQQQQIFQGQSWIHASQSSSGNVAATDRPTIQAYRPVTHGSSKSSEQTFSAVRRSQSTGKSSRETSPSWHHHKRPALHPYSSPYKHNEALARPLARHGTPGPATSPRLSDGFTSNGLQASILLPTSTVERIPTSQADVQISEAWSFLAPESAQSYPASQSESEFAESPGTVAPFADVVDYSGSSHPTAPATIWGTRWQ